MNSETVYPGFSTVPSRWFRACMRPRSRYWQAVSISETSPGVFTMRRSLYRGSAATQSTSGSFERNASMRPFVALLRSSPILDLVSPISVSSLFKASAKACGGPRSFSSYVLISPLQPWSLTASDQSTGQRITPTPSQGRTTAAFLLG